MAALELKKDIEEQLHSSKQDSSDGVKFHRVDVSGPAQPDEKAARACKLLRRAMELRAKYIWKHPKDLWKRKELKPIINQDFYVELTNGLPHVYKKSAHPTFSEQENPKMPAPLFSIPDVREFLTDYHEVLDTIDDVDVKTLASKRLRLLEQKYTLHNALNALEEGDDGTEKDTHRDFCKVHKVDTHVHMAAGMTARQLLTFLLEKAENHADDPVMVMPLMI